MFLEQLQRKRLVPLRQRAIAHHVREHDRGQLALFGVFGRHERIKSDCAKKENNRPDRRGQSAGIRPLATRPTHLVDLRLLFTSSVTVPRSNGSSCPSAGGSGMVTSLLNEPMVRPVCMNRSSLNGSAG